MLEACVRKQSRENGTWRNEDIGIENTVLMVVDVVKLLSHVSLYATPMDCSTPGSSVLHCLLKFAQIHVH